MKKLALTACLGIFVLLQIACGQSLSLEFLLYDMDSKKPVANAHTFIVNTTYGTVSDQSGRVRLSIPKQISEDLLITHVSYNTRLLTAPKYRSLSPKDTLWLDPNNFDLSEITISAKRTAKWKKNFKRFRTAFLGKDKAATKCSIINPEVLRFEDKNEVFTTTAIDLIHLENKFLGYEIRYALNKLTIQKDGSVSYLGKAIYTDLAPDSKEYKKTRRDCFESSPKYFYRSLLHNNLEKDGFEMELVAYRNNTFVPLLKPTREMLLKKNPQGKGFHLQFNEFLKVTNKNVKQVNYSTMGVRAGGLESQKFSNSASEDKPQIDFATSYIFKLTPFLLLDKQGNLLNSKVVKEYGFWAEQRMARQLPFNYGDHYQNPSVTLENELTIPEKTPQNMPGKEVVDSQKLKLFKILLYDHPMQRKDQALSQVAAEWQNEFIPLLIEFLRLSADSTLVQKIKNLLKDKTGKPRQWEYYDWLQWLWENPPLYGSYYGAFRAELYQFIDPIFRQYFADSQKSSKIRLDEIVWGGVRQDGIPPLRQPALIQAADAKYLQDEHIVFGLYLNGIAKAYPKRILAWHEFFTDDFGEQKVAGVYCTLCGTVIAYNMHYKNRFHDLGTSGFLYRSNKLMYDKATQSLWNTIEGKPVVGPLTDQQIQLESFPLVTTTWGDWKKTHPETKVLSLNTGYDRDYSEGAAYSDYFATDKLMFPVPKTDLRLPNKQEVFIIRAPEYKSDPLAISTAFLKRKGWYQGSIGPTRFLVITEKNGAARAYESGKIDFKSYKNGQLIDTAKNIWKVTEQEIRLGEKRLKRLPAHNIFWFAWYNMYPETRLVK